MRESMLSYNMSVGYFIEAHAGIIKPPCLEVSLPQKSLAIVINSPLLNPTVVEYMFRHVCRVVDQQSVPMMTRWDK